MIIIAHSAGIAQRHRVFRFKRLIDLLIGIFGADEKPFRRRYGDRLVMGMLTDLAGSILIAEDLLCMRYARCHKADRYARCRFRYGCCWMGESPPFQGPESAPSVLSTTAMELR